MEIVWVVIIFSLIVAGLLTGLLAFAFLVGGLILPVLIFRKLKGKLNKASENSASQPASRQVIDHDEIKTDKDGSPFID